MKRVLYFSTIFLDCVALILFLKPSQVFAAEENVILKFSGKAYATGFAGSDHQASAEVKFLKEKRGKIVISDSKDFQIKFEAKVGEDLWLRDCEECKVWYELYKEVNGQWTKIFETSLSGGSKIETKSDTFDTNLYGYTQQGIVTKYKVSAKARAKLSVIGEKSWGFKDFVFFVGVAPEGKVSLAKGDVAEWLYLAESRQKSYEELAEWARGINEIDLTYSQCLFKLALSFIQPYMADIGLAASNFVLQFTGYFEPLPTDFPSAVETGIQTSTGIAATLISSQDYKEVVSDFTEPTKNLNEIWSALGEISKIPAKVDEICTAFDAAKSNMGIASSRATEIKRLISQERTSIENVFYKKTSQISETKGVLNQEASLISDLKNNYLINKIVGKPMSEIKGGGGVGAYTYNETAKMIRSFYRPFNYVWEDETIANYFLTGKVTEAEINRIDEEQEAAKAAAAAPKPNLQASLLMAEPIKVNQTVSIAFNLSNVGQATAEADATKTALKVTLDGNLFQDIKFSSFGKIAAGETKRVSFDWRPTLAKNYSFFLLVDPENAVVETIEVDNSFSKTVTVSAEDLPDLVADSLEVQSPESVVHPNEEVTIKASVKNSGKARAENIKIALYLDPHFYETSTGYDALLVEKTVSLKVGEITTIEAKWKPTSGRTYKVALGVDVPAGTKGTIKEEDEDNNILTKTIKVEEPRHELKISCSQCVPAVVNSGERTEPNFFVQNAGNVTDEVILEYETSRGMIFAPQISEQRFKLKTGEFKEIFVLFDVPEEQEPGDYFVKMTAKTIGGEASVWNRLDIKVKSPYQIEILPLCNGRVCQEQEKEKFNQKEAEPEKITSFDFRVQNRGDEFDLGFWIEGNYNGKICYDNGCRGVTLPQGFKLKKNETKDITLKASGKDAGDYNLTLKFNVASSWLLTTYPVTLKVKPSYDFGWKVLKTYELDPQTRFQKFAEIEIENKSNTGANLKAEVAKDSLFWQTLLYPTDLELAMGEKKIIELDAFSDDVLRGEFIRAGLHQVELKLTMADKIKTAKVAAEVKEFHKLSINNWFKKKIPQAQVPLSFSVRNMGNVKEKITVKLLSELKLEPTVITVEAEPYSFKDGRSGLGHVSTTIDARDFSPDKEYQIYIVAQDGDAKDEAITTIVIEPKFQFLCEERDYCSHALRAGAKTEYRILMLNGLDKDVTITLTGEAPEDEKWSWSLGQSEVSLKKGESKTVLLEVGAKGGAEGSYTIVLKGKGNDIEEEIKVITKIGEVSLPIYPGWNAVSPKPPEVKCGNDVCETGETQENCCQDCGCGGGKICDEEKNQCLELVCREDKDCEAACGNGICESDETQTNCCRDCGCPSGKTCEQNQCITAAQCGNGRIEGSEACDDGSANGTYGHCKSDCSALGPRCGDGICQSANENTQNCLSDCPAAPPVAECNDSDNGQDVYVKGTAALNGSSSTDYCLDGDTVREYYCQGNSVLSVDLDCPANYICSDGRCIEKPPSCADSDNGKDIWTKGTVTRNSSSYVDYCTDNVTVHEYFCDYNNVGEEDIGCPTGTICQDGKCLEQAMECLLPYTDCLTSEEAVLRDCQMPPGPVCAETPKWCFICP